MSQKKCFLIPVLSGLLLSTAVLTNQVYAEETTVSTVAETSVSNLTTTAETVSQATTQPAVSSETSQAVPAASETAQTEAASVPSNQTSAASVDTAVTSSDTITILHTNDVHGRIEESSGVIGDAKLATIVNQERAKGETILLDAGDAFQGMPISNSSQGEDMAAIMNLIGYDAMAVGNHEFDFGLDQIKKYKELLTFPLLSSNTYVNGSRLFQASTIIDKDTTKVGDEFVVIGVTTPETATKTHPDNIIGVNFTDPITEVNQVIAEIEARAAAEGKTYPNYIILAHLGVDPTTPVEWQGSTLAQALSENSQLAGKKVIVIDGHSHTVQTATYGDNVTYNQTGSYLNNIGKITLNSAQVLASIIPAYEAKTVEADPTIAAMVAQIKARYDAENATVVIDNSPVELNGDRSNVRVRETNLGNAVADALLAYGQTGFAHPTDLAVTNGGGLRATIAKDKAVTKGDIIAVLPFGNSIAQIQVSGQDIKDMFQKSLSAITQVDKTTGAAILDENGQPLLEASGGFLHVAGARVFYDTNLASDARILAIDIWDRASQSYQPLDLSRTYYLATNDFLAAGGDGYTMLGGSREEGPSLDTVFAAYLAQADLLQYAVINPNSRLVSISSSLDSDGDGFADYQEIQAGTDPSDGASHPDQRLDDDRAGNVSLPRAASSAYAQSTSVYPLSKPVSIPVCYQISNSQQLRQLPLTNSKESMLALLLGVSLIGFGLYGARRQSYGK